MKYCNCCKEFLPFDSFSKRSDKSHLELDDRRRYRSFCYKCDSLKVKLKFFNLTIEEFNLLRERCADCCSICGIHEKEARNLKAYHYGLYIDHCHKTNTVRGLLCHNCNLLIGHAKDNVSVLKAAIEYLDIMI